MMKDLNTVPAPAQAAAATTAATTRAPRKPLRRWIGATVAGGLLAVFGFAAVGHAQGAQWGPPGGPFGMSGMMGGPAMHGPMDPEAAGRRVDAGVAWMLADIDATAEQKKKIADIAKGAMKDLMPLHAQQRAAHERAVALLSAEKIDRAALEQLRVSELALGDMASKRLATAVADAAEVLTPAQRVKLAERMAQRHGRGEMHHGEHHGDRGDRPAPPAPPAPKQ